jgi:hypothetical protein
MSRFYVWALLSASIIVPAQQPDKGKAQSSNVMVVAIARDTSVYEGGTTSGTRMKGGTVAVDPLAWLTPSGDWKSIDCDFDRPEACARFDREYLKKAHIYSVVSADGRGAVIQIEKMSLTPQDDPDSCFGYGGVGTYSGVPIAYATVAAESARPFIAGPSAKRFSEEEAEPIRKAFAESAGEKLGETVERYRTAGEEKIDPALGLRVYSVQLEGQELLVVQRALRDWQRRPEYLASKQDFHLDSVFAVGSMSHGHFNLLYWQRMEDGNQQLLGVIHLKNGKDFIVETVSDPETQFFRIYGIRDGKVSLVFEGGGGGC